MSSKAKSQSTGWGRREIRTLLDADSAGAWGDPPTGNGDVGVIRSTNLNGDGTLDLADVAVRHFPEKVKVKLTLNRGDVLLERSGGGPEQPVGRIAAFESTGIYVCSNFMQRLQANQQSCIPNYLKYLLLDFHQSGRTLRLQQRTSGIRNLAYDEFLSSLVLLPPLDEQKRIAEILNTVGEAIEATRGVIDQTRRLKTALLKDIFTNGLPGRHRKFLNRKGVGRLPQDWKYESLLEVAQFQNGKAFPSFDYNKGTVRLIRPGNLHVSGMVVWDDDHLTTLPEQYLETASDYIVRGNELIMNLTAQSLEDGFLGRVCWTDPDNGVSLLNQRLARFTSTRCSLRFLYWTFRSPAFRAHVGRLPSGTKVKHLYNSDLESFKVSLPGEAEQLSIVQLLDSVEDRERKEQIFLDRLVFTKHALSQGLLTGRIPVKGGK